VDGIVEDVRAATEWLRAQPSVDKEHLVLIGMSGGGYATLAAGASDPTFKGLIALSPLIDPVEASLSMDELNEMAAFVQGVTGAQLKDQFDRLHSIMKMTAGLRDQKILLITGDLDELLPPNHFLQFVKELPEVRWHRFPAGDHYLSACRKQLVETVLGWLKEDCA
jgi:dipeptidyl aminopeptidase/acylaminoacyl peptidase